MSWKAMEVSMSKTRRGKYIDNRICHKGKCKGDMRFNLRGKGKIPCFSYLCEGNHFRFIEERYNNILKNGAVCPVFGFLCSVKCCKIFVVCYKITNRVIFLLFSYLLCGCF